MYERAIVGDDGGAGGDDAAALATALVRGAGPPAVRAVRVGPSSGSVGAGLAAAAREHGADVIVVGSSRRQPVGRTFSGDDVDSVLHHAPCAVALAPRGYAEAPLPLARIGVAYDGRPESRVALAHALALAEPVGAEVVARCVLPAVAIVGEADMRQRVGEPVGVEVGFLNGQAGPRLAAFAETVDLLVCGSRHADGPARLLLGSTSDYLAHHCRAPLLVTPARDEGAVARWLRRAAAPA